MTQKLTNHIAFVLDKSGSMSHLSGTIVEVFDKEISYLRKRSEELDQETRVSVYLFNDSTECLVFDMDVMRVKSLAGQYRASGQTALMDGTSKAIADLKLMPELYTDHAFLVYVLTDGQENNSRQSNATTLRRVIDTLPENWTVVAQVPTASDLHEIKKFGFPANNVQIWQTTSKGLEESGRIMRSSMDTYLSARAGGTRGTKAFFTTDLGTVSASKVRATLGQPLGANNYSLFEVRKPSVIRPFVESWLGSYITGSAYYELMKPETVQAGKQVLVMHRQTGKVYGGRDARTLLALPDYEIRVSPGDHGDWKIFVQSTSVNRNLLAGTQLIVLK